MRGTTASCPQGKRSDQGRRGSLDFKKKHWRRGKWDSWRLAKGEKLVKGPKKEKKDK